MIHAIFYFQNTNLEDNLNSINWVPASLNKLVSASPRTQLFVCLVGAVIGLAIVAIFDLGSCFARRSLLEPRTQEGLGGADELGNPPGHDVPDLYNGDSPEAEVQGAPNTTVGERNSGASNDGNEARGALEIKKPCSADQSTKLQSERAGVTRAKIISFAKNRGVNATDGEGNTILHIAASHGELDMVRLLIELGADVNATNWEGNTILHNAALRGELDTVRFLIKELGADLNIKNDQGHSPLDEADLWRMQRSFVNDVQEFLRRPHLKPFGQRNSYSQVEVGNDDTETGRVLVKTLEEAENRLQKMVDLIEWRPQNHKRYFPHYRLAMKTLVVLSKARGCT